MPPYIQGDFSEEVLPWSPLWSSLPRRNTTSAELREWLKSKGETAFV